MDNALEMYLLGGEQRKALAQVVAVLVAEHGDGAGAGAVASLGAVFEDVAQHVMILFHGLRVVLN